MAQCPQSLVLLTALGRLGNSPFVILLSVASDIKREPRATLAGDPKKTTKRPHWENPKSSSCNPFRFSPFSCLFRKALFLCYNPLPPPSPVIRRKSEGATQGGQEEREWSTLPPPRSSKASVGLGEADRPRAYTQSHTLGSKIPLLSYRETLSLLPTHPGRSDPISFFSFSFFFY